MNRDKYTRRIKRLDSFLTSLSTFMLVFIGVYLILSWDRLDKISVGFFAFAFGFGLNNLINGRIIKQAQGGWDQTLELCGELVNFNDVLIDENIMLRKKFLKKGGKTNDRNRQSKGSSRKS